MANDNGSRKDTAAEEVIDNSTAIVDAVIITMPSAFRIQAHKYEGHSIYIQMCFVVSIIA
jgi:hypothetical protein